MPVHELKPTNRHPVDQLADVRERIKALKAEEDALREQIIASPYERKGEQWIATVTQKPTTRYDTAAIVKHLGTAALQQFKRESCITYIMLKPKP